MNKSLNKIWYLSTCSTCLRIMNELGISEDNIKFELYDLKNNPILESDLEMIEKGLNCGYEFLFNKRALKYSSLGLKGKLVSDADFKREILKEYTFLKRPIILVGDKFFVGNSKKVIDDCRVELGLN